MIVLYSVTRAASTHTTASCTAPCKDSELTFLFRWSQLTSLRGVSRQRPVIIQNKEINKGLHQQCFCFWKKKLQRDGVRVHGKTLMDLSSVDSYSVSKQERSVNIQGDWSGNIWEEELWTNTYMDKHA